jgi:hypothetical protein
MTLTRPHPILRTIPLLIAACLGSLPYLKPLIPLGKQLAQAQRFDICLSLARLRGILSELEQTYQEVV